MNTHIEYHVQGWGVLPTVETTPKRKPTIGGKQEKKEGNLLTGLL